MALAQHVQTLEQSPARGAARAGELLHYSSSPWAPIRLFFFSFFFDLKTSKHVYGKNK